MKIKTAEDLFLEKYGNKITASDSWVLRFAIDYAQYHVTEALKEKVKAIKKKREEDSSYSIDELDTFTPYNLEIII